MGILKRLFRPKQEIFNISRDDLECVLSAAIVRAHKELAKEEAETARLDPLTDAIRTISLITLSFFILGCIFVAASAGLSFLPLSIEALSSVYGIPLWGRIFILLMAVTYGLWGITLFNAIRKEASRDFLVAFFSAVTSIVALVVALQSALA